MNTLQIMINGANLLGLTQEVELLKTITKENEAEVMQNKQLARLKDLAILSMQEVSVRYVPIYSTIELQSENKQINIKQIQNCLKILKVYLCDIAVPFKIVGKTIKVNENGNYKIKYTTMPTINSVLDELEFVNNGVEQVVIFGLCAYYSIAIGLFSQFNSFHEKYLNAGENLKELKMFYIPNRSWQ